MRLPRVHQWPNQDFCLAARRCKSLALMCRQRCCWFMDPKHRVTSIRAYEVTNLKPLCRDTTCDWYTCRRCLIGRRKSNRSNRVHRRREGQSDVPYGRPLAQRAVIPTKHRCTIQNPGPWYTMDAKCRWKRRYSAVTGLGLEGPSIECSAKRYQSEFLYLSARYQARGIEP